MMFRAERNRNTLLNIKDVLIHGPIRASFFLFGVSVKVYDPDIGEGLQPVVPQASKCWILQISMICYETQHPVVRMNNLALAKTNELDVVVLQPLRVLFAKRFSTNEVVVLD